MWTTQLSTLSSHTTMAPDINIQARSVIAKNTIDPAIVAKHKHQGASADSVFIRSQLPTFDPSAYPARLQPGRDHQF